MLLNLFLNAYYALSDVKNPTVIVKAWSDNNGDYISVEDKGRGISKEVIKKIFIPFFTTRSNGSGIGLSLSKQIMSLHGGSINVESSGNEGTTVLLTFDRS